MKKSPAPLPPPPTPAQNPTNAYGGVGGSSGLPDLLIPPAIYTSAKGLTTKASTQKSSIVGG